jgi:hypothetical protein
MTTRCGPTTLCCGPFVAGEIPDPVVYSFQKADGSPLPLDGYTAWFCWAERWGGAGQADAQVSDAAGGEVTYAWTGGELAAPGRYTGQFWVDRPGSPPSRYASLPIRFDVYAPVCAAPAA